MSGTDTLKSRFELLQDERARSWSREALDANIAQRRLLIEQAKARRLVRAGDAVTPFSLETLSGGKLTLDDLLKGGPVVLIYFRFATCPACNIALSHYRDHLWPGLVARGVGLVALSPQVPEKLDTIQQAHHFPFPVATDRDHALARRLGIVFEYDEAAKAAARAAGSFIGDITGTGTWELPWPTIILIGRDRIVHFAKVSPDWLERPEASEVLEALDGLMAAEAA